MIIETLKNLKDPRKEALLKFHQDHIGDITQAQGSTHNHQAWSGGYIDHISECFKIAKNMHESLSSIRPLPFKLDSAIIIMYFHDVEKIWKRTLGKNICKETFYYKTLLEDYSIEFSEKEVNALKFVHGENQHYSSTKRVMNELAAFCHAVDCISARIWWDHPKK